MTVENPISENIEVSPRIKVETATMPKSDLSKKRASIDNLNIAAKEVNKVDIVIHFAPEIDAFFIDDM